MLGNEEVRVDKPGIIVNIRFCCTNDTVYQEQAGIAGTD